MLHGIPPIQQRKLRAKIHRTLPVSNFSISPSVLIKNFPWFAKPMAAHCIFPHLYSHIPAVPIHE